MAWPRGAGGRGMHLHRGEANSNRRLMFLCWPNLQKGFIPLTFPLQLMMRLVLSEGDITYIFYRVHWG